MRWLFFVALACFLNSDFGASDSIERDSSQSCSGEAVCLREGEGSPLASSSDGLNSTEGLNSSDSLNSSDVSGNSIEDSVSVPEEVGRSSSSKSSRSFFDWFCIHAILFVVSACFFGLGGPKFVWRRLTASKATSTASTRRKRRSMNPPGTLDGREGEGGGVRSQSSSCGDKGDSLEDMEYPPVPGRYLRGCNGDEKEAQRRWRQTVQWRREYNMDSILQEDQPKYKEAKTGFPIFFHGRSKGGHPILYEQMGKVDLPLLRANELYVEPLLRHYVFFVESMWGDIMAGKDDQQMITVEDVAGVGLANLTPMILKFIRGATGVMKSHYVERCYRTYIINAPFLFTAVWRLIAPLLDANTRAKVVILGTDFRSTVLEDIAEDQLPVEYGGASAVALGESSDEQHIQAMVERNSKAQQRAVQAAADAFQQLSGAKDAKDTKEGGQVMALMRRPRPPHPHAPNGSA